MLKISENQNTMSDTAVAELQSKLKSHPCSISLKLGYCKRVGPKTLGGRCLNRFHEAEIVILVTVTFVP